MKKRVTLETEGSIGKDAFEGRPATVTGVVVGIDFESGREDKVHTFDAKGMRCGSSETIVPDMDHDADLYLSDETGTVLKEGKHYRVTIEEVIDDE